MISVQKIDCALFADFSSVFTEIWGEGSETKWRRLFDYTWERNENYCGLVLKDGPSAVGFLGMIFSRRRINGNIEKFCNLTSWFVRREYRIKAMSMLLPLLAMKDYTITDLTPAKNVYRIQNRIGFKDLDAKGRILLPFGRRLAGPRPSDIRITHDPAEIENRLQGEHLKIFNDHKIYRCSHFLLTAGDRYCYLIYAKLKRKRLPYVHVHYISDRDLFARDYRCIRNSILSHCGAYFMLIDSRLAGAIKLPFSFCLPYRAPKQYLSSTLQPEQIDNLYSELILLNLKTHPRFKYLIRYYRRKIFGSK
jgi:hypothetical protein